MKIYLLLLLLWAAPLAAQSQWQKIDKQGTKVDIKMGPWHCATDQHTGLTWEVKSWHETQHYYKATYTYFNPTEKLGVIDGGSCQQGDEWYPCDVSDLISYMNAQAYCGITTWRLPTLKELKTLIYHKNISGKLKINQYIFPRSTRSRYLTSDITINNGILNVTMMDFFKAIPEQRASNVVANVRLVTN